MSYIKKILALVGIRDRTRIDDHTRLVPASRDSFWFIEECDPELKVELFAELEFLDGEGAQRVICVGQFIGEAKGTVLSAYKKEEILKKFCLYLDMCGEKYRLDKAT
jgi:hypothetical protein